MALARTINDAHPAAADLLEDLVITDSPVPVVHIYFTKRALQFFVLARFRTKPLIEQTFETKPAADA